MSAPGHDRRAAGRAGPATAPGAGAGPAAPLVRLQRADCGYGRRVVVHGVSLVVPRRAVTAFIGRNGAGKTTVLRTALGLIPPLAGTVERTERVGYAPQVDASEVTFPVSARDVVLMGLTPALGIFGRPGREARERVDAALRLLRVLDLAERPFRALSGGQRQRVLLARGLVSDPELLVLDEPVRGLDVATTAALVALMVQLARERGLGVLVATHSLDLVANHADHVALFREGEIVSGPADEVMTEATLTRFVGRPMAVRTVAGQRVVVPDLDAVVDDGVEVAREGAG